MWWSLPPWLARCSQGYLGIVYRYGLTTYPDGSQAYACLGRHLPKFWHRWSSRTPRTDWWRRG